MKSKTSPSETSALTNSEDVTDLLFQNMTAIRQWLNAHVSDPASRADIFQETFLAAMLCVWTFQGNAAYSTWLIGIAKNKTRKFLEGEGRKGTSRNGREAFDEVLHSPTGAYHSIDTNIDLERLLSVLPKEQRENIRLHYIDGYSMEELAAMRGCTRDAMKKRMKRAMDRVKDRREEA